MRGVHAVLAHASNRKHCLVSRKQCVVYCPTIIQAKKKLEKLYIRPLYMYMNTFTQHYCAGLIRPTQ